MKHPEDFPKALYAVTAAEFALFLTVGIVVYWYTGQYASAPAVAVLADTKYKKAAFAPVLVVSVLIGIIVSFGGGGDGDEGWCTHTGCPSFSQYGSVVSKYIFVRLFGKTKHYAGNTALGWISWVCIVFATWVSDWPPATHLHPPPANRDSRCHLPRHRLSGSSWAKQCLSLTRSSLLCPPSLTAGLASSSRP